MVNISILHYMVRFLGSILILFIIGCTETKKESDTVLFAGEIVNPTNTQVILFKGSEKIDSAQLDQNNRFSFKLPTVENGLYHFNHAPEAQYVYLEKGDSLLVRLNTIYFDESLVFSGSNEILNNFLLELFLSEEEEDADMHTEYYELEPSDFEDKVGSLMKGKIKRLESIKKETDISEDGYNLLRENIYYTYNRFKEIYPFQHKRKTTEENFHELPSGFYDYREQINYNDESLTYLRPYYDFLKSHFGNISYMTCMKGCSADKIEESKQLHFNKHKLNLIDSLVANKELRDNLFRNVAFDYLLKKHDAPENIEIFIKEFKTVSKNNMHIEEIENLYQKIVNLQPSNPIPNLPVVSIENTNLTLQEIAKDKKVIFYFWSDNNKKQYQDIFKRVADLQKRKPDHTLIGINIKTEFEDWAGIVKSSQLDPNTQYHTNDYKELTETLVIYPMNKSIITDNAVIVDGFANIYNN